VKKQSLEERFWSKVDTSGECWEWTGTNAGQGYGQIRHNKQKYLAHRLSWQIHHGPIPEGLLVCHHCDNPPCVNPDHLFLGTVRENYLDAFRKGRTKQPCPETGRLASAMHPERLPRGTSHPFARFTEYDIRKIRALHALGATSKRRIAEQYNTSPSVIRAIIARTAWSHVR
jgi:hypothetical protein